MTFKRKRIIFIYFQIKAFHHFSRNLDAFFVIASFPRFQFLTKDGLKSKSTVNDIDDTLMCLVVWCAYTFISGKVCLLSKLRSQTLPEINVYTRLFSILD